MIPKSTRIPLAGNAAFDIDRECLTRAGKPVHLRRQTFDVLRYLVEQRGRLVTKERFVEEVWRGRAVTDGSLGKCIEELREALGPEAAGCLRTVRGRGYILEGADIEPPEAPLDPPPDPAVMASPQGTPTRKPARVGSNVFVMVSVAAVVLGTAAFVYFVRSAALRQPIQSVAVMPFANGTGDPQLDYLCDGITEQTIDRLSRLSGLRVTAQSAVVHFKGQDADAQSVGHQLGVRAVLVGRVTKHGNTVGVTLELVDARDNRHIWGDEYERNVADLPAMAQEISAAVSVRLRPALSGHATDVVESSQNASGDVYQLYLKGRYSWEQWTVDGAKQAIAYFNAAIDKNPEYARAYAGLADVYVFGSGAINNLPQSERHRRGRQAAATALSLDPQLAEAHAALAEVLLYDDWDFAGAERELRRALELNPNYAEAHHFYSHVLLLLGRYEESLRESRAFLELDPVSESPIGHLAWHYISARHFDEGIAQSLKDLQSYPDSPQDLLEDAYYAKGMFREAADAYIKLRAHTLTPMETADLRAAFAASGFNGFLRKRLEQLMNEPPAQRDDVAMAGILAQLGQTDQAFQHLDLAYARHADTLLHVKERSRFDALRGDPRYTTLLRRIGLAQ